MIGGETVFVEGLLTSKLPISSTGLSHISLSKSPSPLTGATLVVVFNEEDWERVNRRLRMFIIAAFCQDLGFVLLLCNRRSSESFGPAKELVVAISTSD